MPSTAPWLGRATACTVCDWLRQFIANGTFRVTPLNRVFGASMTTTDRIFAFVQVVTGLAVVVSLVLVLLQLKQNEQIAQAQLTSETFKHIQELDSKLMGEDFATSMVNVVDPGITPSDADLYRYDAYVFSTILTWRRLRSLSNIGLFDTKVDDMIDKRTACWFFGHDVGQAWLKGNFSAGGEDDVVLRLKALSSECGEVIPYIEFMRSELGKETGGT